MRIKLFLKVFGTLIKILGALMLIPALVSLIYGEYDGVVAFVVPALFALALGLVLEFMGLEDELGNKEGFALVAFGWLGAALIGAIPYFLLGLSPIDAFFESMSGFTTTGATILSENNAQGYWLINTTATSHSVGSALGSVFNQTILGHQPINAINTSYDSINTAATNLNNTILNNTTINASAPNATLVNLEFTGKTYYGLLFWRSFTQWLGGMGIILLFIAILPNLGVAGRQLFRAEVPGPTEDMLRPRIRGTAKILWGVYMVLTAAEFLLLMLVGMPAYDAICNTFSTMACGGFSPQAESIAAYGDTLMGGALVEGIVILFMFLAGANFALHYRTMYVDRKSPFKDTEFKFYALLVLISIFIIMLFGGMRDGAFLDNLRSAAFQVVSIVTTTGFATEDYDGWSSPAKVVLFVLMFTGACAGSTAGGIKLVRILLMIRYGRRELIQALHPQAVVPIKLKGSPVREEILHSILSFFAFYILIFAVATVIFSAACSGPNVSGEIGEMNCFVAEDGKNVVCFPSDEWDKTGLVTSFRSDGREGAENIACFMPNESVKKNWVEIDRIVYPISDKYERSSSLVCTWQDGCAGIDLVSAASAVAVNLGNVGPGFNSVGPTDNFSQISGLGKLVLIICMWIGRLEILTVLILLVPDFWRS